MAEQTLTEDRLALVMNQFERLGLDLTKLTKLIADRDELARRLEVNRGELLALRPSSKDYDRESQRLTQVTGALAAQLDAAREDVAAEVLSLKYKAATEADLSELRKRAQALDEEWLKVQMHASGLLDERNAATVEHNELIDIIAGYAWELRLDPPGKLQTPWHATWPGNPGQVKQIYTERFLRMIGSAWPEPGQELVLFARKFW